jgi:hypothetical protein
MWLPTSRRKMSPPSSETCTLKTEAIIYPETLVITIDYTASYSEQNKIYLYFIFLSNFVHNNQILQGKPEGKRTLGKFVCSFLYDAFQQLRLYGVATNGDKRMMNWKKF